MQTVITEFENFMGKHGQYYHEFYIGIASDPNDRLVNGHGVTINVPNIYWTAPLQTQIVRAIEKHFLNRGTKDGPGGGDNNTCSSTHIKSLQIQESEATWTKVAGL